MDAATQQRLLNEMGLGTDEERIVAQMHVPGLTIALLSVLRNKGLITDEDVDAVHRSADTVAEKLGHLTLSAFTLGLWAEGQANPSLEGLKFHAKRVVDCGSWLLEDSLAIHTDKREELASILDVAAQALVEVKKEEEANASSD